VPCLKVCYTRFVLQGEKDEKRKNSTLHFVTGAAFVILIVLGLACATTPSAQIELGANYRAYLQPPVGNERVIDTIGVRASNSFVCRDPQHSITRGQVLGATYQLGGETVLRNSAEAQNTAMPNERHRDEVILDQLLNEAKKQYLNETVNIRNAKTARHIPTNARLEDYYDPNSGYYYTRTVWDCFLYYTADVITTDPWPQPVTHTENFTMPGLSRADIYRRAYNWLDDNITRRRIQSLDGNFDLGRIKGSVICYIRTDRSYRVMTNFTVDVYDARVEIRFDEAILQRTNADQQVIGNPERIFLQSIADAAQEELIDFSTSLRSYIVSR